jgi:hypothetical protein
VECQADDVKPCHRSVAWTRRVSLRALFFLSYRQVEISTWTSCRSIVRSRASSGPATRRPQNVRRDQWGQGHAPTLLAIDSALCLPVPASWFAVRKRSLTFSLSLSLCSGVRDTVIVEERSGAETSETETEEETEPDRHASATATAAASNSDDQPAAPGLCVPRVVTGQRRRPRLAHLFPLPQVPKT